MLRGAWVWGLTLVAGCSGLFGYDEVSFEQQGHAAGSGGAGAKDAASDGGASGWEAGQEAGAGQGGAGQGGMGGLEAGPQGGAAGSMPAGGSAGTGGSACPDGTCSPGESCESCAQDCGACPVAEPNQLVGIHFWDDAAGTELAGPKPYYDVEAFESAVDPNTVVAWLQQREAAGARGIIRIDYQWGYSVPKNDADRQTYNGRLVAIAKAVAGAGLKTHHYVLGNESNLPGEGAASVTEVGEAYGAAHAALAAAGPWSIAPVLLTTPPSTAAQYGGGDGSYLTGVLNESKARAPIDGIAVHAYENHDGGGSANLFMATVLYQAQAIQATGLSGLPIFVTEMNIDLNLAGDAVGATFVNNAYSRLDAWNQGGEGNPNAAGLKVAAGCWFVWHDDGNWGHLALQGSHLQTKEAFKAAFAKGYSSGWPQ